MKQIFTLALFSCALITKAQTNIIGAYVKNNTSNPELHIIKWNANTGAIITDATTPYSTCLLGSNVFDAFNGNYYIRVSDSTGGISDFAKYNVNNNNITLINNATLMTAGAEVDMSTGKIYNITSITGSGWDLAEYDIANGNMNTIANLVNNVSIFNDKSTCYNSNAKTMYCLGYINGSYNITSTTVNGGIASSIALSDQNTPLATEMQYDNTNNKIYGICTYDIGGGNTEIRILQINPTTGAVTTLYTLNNSNYLLYQPGTITYNQNSNQLIFTAITPNYERRLLAYNTQTNTINTLNYPIGLDSLALINYDADNIIYAKTKYTANSITAPTQKTTSIFPNPSQGSFTIGNMEQIKQISIYNLQGALVFTGANKLVNTTLANGIYTLKIWDKNGGIKILPLVINK